MAQVAESDSTVVVSDTIRTVTDTLPGVSNELKSKVHYTATDSIRFDLINERVFLYGKARIEYEDLDLEAAYIEIDWNARQLYASSVPDSSGQSAGQPVFKQNQDAFISEKLTYNFDTKKGKITQVTTQQGEGFIHGETVKKTDDENFFIRKGAYTTCENPHPHYSISSNKTKGDQER